ncbi:MAG: hypothetical protein WD992_03635 [Candidatus Levyibacteriota bacterium]
MLRSKKNRKSKNYFKYLGILFVILGISLILMTAFVYISPFVFKKSILSPLPKNFTGQNQDIESLLRKEKINFSDISIATDSSYLVYLEDGGQAIISHKKNLSEQVRSLQIVLSRLTIEGKRFKSLDFRFEKPVISF